MIRTKRAERILLIFILLLATVLRFYNLWDIPFTHDEFSALFRTRFSGFEELIAQGVLPDFHPAGVQIFLYYYIGLFGETAGLVKLPFILSGLGSVYLVYRIGKEWFNAETGLLTAAFMSVTQYFIFYSQIARPYSPGLFFGLWAFLHWGRLIFAGNTLRIRDYLLWITAAALCAYTHYYLLLTLVLLSAIGLLFIRKRYIPLYILSGVGIALLYLPHFLVFFAQLSKGGIGTWLGKPQPDFLGDFFYYVFEFLPSFLIFTLIITATALAVNYRCIKISGRWWMGILLFVACWAVGYFYSIRINPILQFSGLIFSLPLLLLSIFYFTSLRSWLFYPALAGICGFGVYGLVFEREHYHIFYQSPYEHLVANIKSTADSLDNPPLILLDGRKDIMQYYLERYGIDTAAIHLLEQKDLPQIAGLIQNAPGRDILIGTFYHTFPEVIPIAQHYFPYLKTRKMYYQGEFYHLSQSSPALEDIVVWQNTIPPAPGYECRYCDPGLPSYMHTDSLTGKSFYAITAENEFGPGMTITDLHTLAGNHNRFLDVIAEIEAGDLPEKAQICTAVYQGDSILIWDASPMITGFQGLTFPAFHSLPLNYNVIGGHSLSLKIFIWNMGRENFRVRKLTVQLRKGNPELYALYTPVLKD